MKKFLLISFAILFTHLSIAQAEFAKYRIDDGSQYVHGLLGFGAGGISLGADYEMGMDQNVGWGGSLRYYPENTATTATRIFYLGAFIRPHWPRNSWDFYISPGAGLSMAKRKDDSETLITPSLAIGTSYAFSQSLTVGVESMTIHGITSDKFRGVISLRNALPI